MLENEIIPLYFAKNSMGYSPEWIQYIKRSIGHIAPQYTMQRMIEDYIDRFYAPEAKRFAALSADNDKLAKEIAAWKEKVAAAWDGVKVLDITSKEELNHNGITGQTFSTTVKIDANGLADDLGLELVIDKIENNTEKRIGTIPFKVVAKEGNTVTFEVSDKLRDPGVFRYGYRLYPVNANLPHRQDFAFVRWI